MEGYNANVFAYGQTSSGKTYTMNGKFLFMTGRTPSNTFVIGTERQPGIISQAVKEVCSYIQRTANTKEFLLCVSYMEIYNESIRDLLCPKQTDLHIHEDKKKWVYVHPLKEEIVTNPSQVLKLLSKGEINRHVSATDFNLHSSRSHAIF
jgi:hypothetical protein